MTAPTIDLAAQAGALLDALGTDVAGSLRTAGARGYQCSGGRCPVAVYLRNNGIRLANVRSSFVEVYTGDKGWVSFPTPEPVAVFVHAFDLGGYADLRLGEVEGWRDYIEGAETTQGGAA